MPPQKKVKSEFLMAKDSFARLYQGVPVVIRKGDLIRADDPRLKGMNVDELFEPAKARFDPPIDRVEAMTAEPGELRGETV